MSFLLMMVCLQILNSSHNLQHLVMEWRPVLALFSAMGITTTCHEPDIPKCLMDFEDDDDDYDVL